MRLRRSVPPVLALLLLLGFSPPGAAQGKVWRIGLFHVGLDHVPPSLEPLRQELKALGYQEGKNVRLDWRNLPDEDAARETAKEFVRTRVDLIVAFENQTVRAAKAAASEIPIVFLHVSDPVADGVVKSLSHPGGNLTGFSGIGDVPAKEVELFKEVVPGLRRLVVLFDPQDPVTPRRLAEMRRAGALLKLQLVEREAATPADLERVFASIKRGGGDGVIAASINLRVKFSSLLLRLASERHLALYAHRKEWVEQGGLFTYAPDLAPVGTLSARYIDRILKGARPADLPVEELSQFKLVINLKTAKALGLAILQPVLLRADTVIQ
ncbi:MAG: ABC transporter substrate-binding protein [Candidatus Rokubacteria bacterium]|nr:ABC transporter substrate-binding protein [Candidatus Rokubacteria bacterium]